MRNLGHGWYVCTHDGCSLGSGHDGPHGSSAFLSAEAELERYSADQIGTQSRLTKSEAKALLIHIRTLEELVRRA